ncbi:Heparanase-like protein 3 [Platanthera zijinensis]|uniref:Heparanase-like protein 3 n=1 Tax=Platanthera zijinensis TaxID=2320716 RepID=A0AAP0B2S0_9ASPA
MAGVEVLRLLVVLFVVLSAASPGAAWVAEGEEVISKGTAVVDGSAAIATTDNEFICATLDWWPPEKCDYGSCSWGQASVLNLVIISVITNFLALLRIIFVLMKIMLHGDFVAGSNEPHSSFSPLRLRVGGSLDDKVIYESGGNARRPCVPFVKNDSALFEFNDGCLPLKRWDHLNSFFKKTGAQVIFGLNALNGRVPMQDGSVGGPWNHKNAESLIRYTAMKGYNIFGWELGNELSGKGIRVRVDVAQYAADLISLKKVVDEIHNGDKVKPLLIAPGGNFETEWYSEFIDMTKASSSLDVITHHMYILGPGVDDHLVKKILNPSFLDRNVSTFSNLREVIRKSGAAATAWVGEAGGAYNSGRHLRAAESDCLSFAYRSLAARITSMEFCCVVALHCCASWGDMATLPLLSCCSSIFLLRFLLAEKP